MKFLTTLIFIGLFYFTGLAQQQNQVKKPDMVQPASATRGSSIARTGQPAQKTLTGFDKPVPSTGTLRQIPAQEKKPARQLVPLDPDKAVKSKN